MGSRGGGGASPSSTGCGWSKYVGSATIKVAALVGFLGLMYQGFEGSHESVGLLRRGHFDVCAASLEDYKTTSRTQYSPSVRSFMMKAKALGPMSPSAVFRKVAVPARPLGNEGETCGCVR